MADTVEFELVSPERLLLSAPVEMVVIPGAEGDFGVLPGHAPMISTLRTGVIATYAGGNVDKQIFVAGGFAEVAGPRCTVLAEEAVALDEIDRAAVEARVTAARDNVDSARDDAQRALAETALATALALQEAVSRSGAG